MKRASIVLAMSTTCLFFVSRPFHADEAADEVRTKVINELRDGKKLLAHESKPRPRLTAQVVLAQVELRDVEGALKTFELIRATDWALLHPHFSDLAVLQVQLGHSEDALKTIDSTPNPAWWQPVQIDALLAVAHTARMFGRTADADTAVALALNRAARMDDSEYKANALFGLTIKLVKLREIDAARKMQRLFEAANAKAMENEETRADALCRIVILNAKLVAPKAAKKILQDGYQAIDTRLPASGGAQRKVAAALAEFCEHEDELPATITYADLAAFQLAKNDLTGAARTARAMVDGREQVETLNVIAKKYARAGEAGSAVAVAELIQNESQRATAMLDIATILARHGDKQKARKIAETLTYPKTRFLGERKFNFRDQSTWSILYEDRGVFTMTWWEHVTGTAGDLTAAAIRCQVALDGKANVPSKELVEHWHVRKAAHAQVGAGDARGAFHWVDRLTGAQRLDALLGTADGFADLRNEAERK